MCTRGRTSSGPRTPSSHQAEPAASLQPPARAALAVSDRDFKADMQLAKSFALEFQLPNGLDTQSKGNVDMSGAQTTSR